MAISKRETVTFRDVTLIFKNFAGEAKKFNKEGVRNFSILLDERQAAELMAQRWNVKPLKPRDEDPEPLFHLKIAVNFANKPPRCWLVTSGGRTMIGEGLVGMFDQLEHERIDLTITPYDWEVNGEVGRKAYLESMFFTMYESELEREYANVPQISAAGDRPAMELESRPHYDFEGEVDEER